MNGPAGRIVPRDIREIWNHEECSRDKDADRCLPGRNRRVHVSHRQNGTLLQKESAPSSPRLLNRLAAKLVAERVAEVRVVKLTHNEGEASPRMLLECGERLDVREDGREEFSDPVNVVVHGRRPGLRRWFSNSMRTSLRRPWPSGRGP